MKNSALTNYQTQSTKKKYHNQPSITNKMVLDAQRSWANMVLELAKFTSDINNKFDPSMFDQLSKKNSDYFFKKIKSCYYFADNNNILFKPTLAKGKTTFRHELKPTLSYFINNQDAGFALNNWQSVKFYNSGIKIINDLAIVMGVYSFSTALITQTSKKAVQIHDWADYKSVDDLAKDNDSFINSADILVDAHFTMVFKLLNSQNKQQHTLSASNKSHQKSILKIISHHSSKV